MQENLFTPNYSKEKKKFTLTIDVYENCSQFGIILHNSSVTNYQEIVGTLETTKHRLMDKQSAINMETFEKNKKAESKKAKNFPKLKKQQFKKNKNEKRTTK